MRSEIRTMKNSDSNGMFEGLDRSFSRGGIKGGREQESSRWWHSKLDGEFLHSCFRLRFGEFPGY